MVRRRVSLLDDTKDDNTSASRLPTSRKRAPQLTSAQWLEIQQRILAGEKPNAFAHEYDVTPQAIYQRCVTGVSARFKADSTRKLAASIAKSENAFASLPVVEQVMVRTLADHLKNISNHLAGAATNGARNAHRLSQIASDCIAGMDAENAEEQNGILLTAAMQATGGANEAAKIGLNLLTANKEMLKDDPGSNVYDMTPHLIKDENPVEASMVYQRLVAGKRQWTG